MNKYFGEVFFLFLSAITFFSSLYVDSVVFSISSIWFIFALTLVFFNKKKDFLDPRVFITSFFALYHTWFPLSYVIGKPNRLFSVNEDFLIQSISYSLFGLISFINVTSFFLTVLNKRNYSFKNRGVKTVNKATSLSNYFIFYLTVAIAIFSMFFFSNSGLESKSDINAEGGAIKTISYFSMLLANVVILIRAARLRYQAIFRDVVIVLFLLISLFYVGYTGERDTLFRTLICLMLIYYSKTKTFNTFKILGFIFSVSILVPVSQAFKAVLLSGFGGVVLELNTVFSNEFISASRNLYSLIHFEVDYEPSFIFSDFLRALVPSALIGDSNIFSAGQWFNSSFRVENGFSGRAGWGFGIIAEGYLVGGYPGVLLVMALMSMLVAKLYILRVRSEYFFVWYILVLTVVLYVLRADMANLISQTFKINGLAVLLIYIASQVFVKMKPKK